jgi:hypothetical protein
MREDDATVKQELQALENVRMSKEDIKRMLQLRYPDQVAARVVAVTPLDFVVQGREEIRGLLKEFPEAVVVGILESQKAYTPGQGQQTGTPPPGPGPQAGTIPAVLVGTWQGQVANGQIQLVLADNGQYQFLADIGGQQARDWGTCALAGNTLWAQQPGYPFPQPPGGQPAPPGQGPGQLPPPPPPRQPQVQPLPPPPQTQYYIAERGRVEGPFSLEWMQQRIQAGQLKDTDYVWKTGMAQWVEAKTLGELRIVFEHAKPLTPLPPEAEIKQFMVGTWSGESLNTMTGATIRTVARYNTDGTFSGTQTATHGSTGGAVTAPIRGSWTVTALTDREFTLTLIVHGWGMPSSWTFAIIDANTLQLKGEGTLVYRVRQ